MSSYFTALQINLLGLTLLIGVHRLSRKTRFTPLPLKLPLLAALMMP